MRRQYGIVVGPETYEKLIQKYEVWLSDNQDIIEPALIRLNNINLIKAYKDWKDTAITSKVMVFDEEYINNLNDLPNWYVELCGIIIDEYLIKAGGHYYHSGWTNFIEDKMTEFQGVWFEDVTTGSDINKIQSYTNETLPFFWFIPLDNQHTALVHSDTDIYDSEDDVINEIRNKLKPFGAFYPDFYLRDYNHIICMTYLDKYPR